MAGKEAQSWDSLVRRAGLAVYDIDAVYGGLRSWDLVPYEVRVKFPEPGEGEVLIILKAHTEEGNVVSFHGGTDFASAFTGMVERLRNGSLKWRGDKPYGGVAG